MRCEVLNASPKTANTYRQALSAIKSYCDLSNNYILSDQNLRGWLSYMFHVGYSVKTVTYYFNILAALHHKALKSGYNVDPNAFNSLKTELKQLQHIDSTESSTLYNLKQLPALIYSVEKEKKEIALYITLFLLSLYERGASLQQIAYLGNEHAPALLPYSQSLTKKYTDSRRKYILPLNQSRRTQRQLTADISKKINFILTYKGLKPAANLDDTALNMWIYTALHCGVSPDEVLGCIDRIPNDNLSLRFHTRKQLDDDAIRQISTQVASCLTCNPLQWHAMRLRPHVTPQNIFDRLKQNTATCNLIESTFYPCEEIAIRIGKKLTYKQQPLIADVLFFRVKTSNLLPLFRIIGDLAWCYRSGSTYAFIPDTEMLKFQRTIGIFSADMDIVPIGTHRLGKGSKVRITGGPMAGYEGLIHRMPSAAGFNTSTRIFQLMIIGNQGIEWTADINESLIETID